MRRSIFGRHLHNQIVMPLVVASVVVGIVATVLAVYLLSRLIDDWVDVSAAAAAESVESALAVDAATLSRTAKIAAENPQLKERVRTGDPGAITAVLAVTNGALKTDNLMLLDGEGRVVSTTGALSLRPGDSPLRPADRTYVALMMSHVVFIELGGVPTLTAFEPMGGTDDTVHTLALTRRIDDAFLDVLTEGSGASYCLSLPGRGHVAASVGTDPHNDALREVIVDDPRLKGLAALDLGPRETRTYDLEVGGSRYRVRIGDMLLEDDPTDSRIRVMSIMSTDVTAQARGTTTALILMWSAFAVCVLVWLGNWVARRVSRPLASLASISRRVAEGDFAATAVTEGANEITDLAVSFNQMTDSLRERTESLTKKVLELATLYEMSRSLGSTFDLDALLESVLDAAMRIFNVDSGYVTLREKDSGRFVLKTSRGAVGRTPERTVRSSMSEWVVREGRPLIFNPTDEVPHEADPMTGASAALCVPLTTSEGVIGTITIGSHNPAVRFSAEDVRLLSTIANHVSIAIGNIELFLSLQDAYLATVRSLAEAVDAKDPFTRGHSDKVASLAVRIGERLGLSAEQRIALEMAAYLHDIGKIGIREEILMKPGRLTEAEMGQMRHHPLIGANILKPVAFPWPIAPVVRHHHEHWDGRGYPAGLRGEEIPLLARILSVADSYEAMVSDRPYRPGRSGDEAIEELRRCSGTQFDPKVVEAFVGILEAERGDRASAEEQPALGDLQPEELHATFVALCDGMFAEFRRLGGPRLAANLERQLNESCAEKGMPCVVRHGHFSLRTDGSDPAEHMAVMTEVIDRMVVLMEHTSGHTLVEHFYAQALSDLSERMRSVASVLQLRESA